MQPIYVSKNLIAASSNGIGSVSTAATSVVTLNTSALDTGRRIVFYSTADASTITFTVTGYGDQRAAAFSESVRGSTASGLAATTTSDFSRLTAVSVSSNANIPFLIGTSSVGGTQWKLTNWYGAPPMQIGAGLVFSTSANGVTGSIEFTMDDPTQVFPNGSVPTVLFSTTHVSGLSSFAATTTSWGNVNTDGQVLTPIAAWRLTVTSSSSGAGTVSATVMQAGIG